MAFNDIVRSAKTGQSRTIQRSLICLDQQLFQLGPVFRSIALDADICRELRLCNRVASWDGAFHVREDRQSAQAAMNERFLFESV